MSDTSDSTQCALGEGPLWHPLREQLFWFDILSRRLLSREGGKTRAIQFEEHVSAAGWVSDSALLIASETRLICFDLETEKSEDVEGLEPDDALTRSNDGRGDPWGGFWIGTMAKDAAKGAGAIYRYYDGKLHKLFDRLSIPNAICFSPDRKYAYYTDTATQVVMRQKLEPDRGWPEGDPAPWLDLSEDGLNPDGAVIDASGNFWNAQWEAGRVAVYNPEGVYQRAIPFPASQTTCPAFGGPDLTTLFCTSAREGLNAPTEFDGMTFAVPETGQGQREHQVKL